MLYLEKKNLIAKYIWSEDIWGVLDAVTGQWNGIVRQVV
jgi:hypothetical protein